MEDFIKLYVDKQKPLVPHINIIPPENLGFIVVIPAFCEPELAESLESLWNSDRPKCQCEVIIVINSSENDQEEAKDLNKKILKSTENWIAHHYDKSLQFFIIYAPILPFKDAGVGLARKIGMDEALYRFNLINKNNGYIISFDADSKCWKNYFTEIENAVLKSDVKGFDIYFEHPVKGNEFPIEIYEGIIYYELHLRYLIQFLRYSGFPYAYHTVGSCFGVRADIYAAQGGMNKRKGGEDFYFLHKVIPLGNFIDITTTKVIPSPRVSLRVPFGTGIAINKYLIDKKELTTYDPGNFHALHDFFKKVPGLFKADEQNILSVIESLPVVLSDFLIRNEAVSSINEINLNCRTFSTFINRFFRWFNAFRIVKFLNHSSLNYLPNIPVTEAVRHFLKTTGYSHHEKLSARELLDIMRTLESSDKNNLSTF